MGVAFTRLAGRGPISPHSPGAFQFGTKLRNGALLISAGGIYDWRPAGAGLDEAGLLQFLDGEAESRGDFLLLGTGRKPLFLSARFRDEVDRRGLGLEAMDTMAACRTYNVLLAENRMFVAALMPI
jgi:uncharacterized protein